METTDDPFLRQNGYALLGDPALLILDEPINGLDTYSTRIMREILVCLTGGLLFG